MANRLLWRVESFTGCLRCLQISSRYFLREESVETWREGKNYWRNTTLPLAWWVANTNTSAICTCAGAETA